MAFLHEFTYYGRKYWYSIINDVIDIHLSITHTSRYWVYVSQPAGKETIGWR